MKSKTVKVLFILFFISQLSYSQTFPSEAEFDNDYYKTRYIDQVETVQSDKYCGDLWFDEAITWMNEKVEKKESKTIPFWYS